MCCLFPSVPPTGENITEKEFGAIGDMLSACSWELPNAEELKNDLAMPAIIDMPGVGKSTSSSIVMAGHRPDPAGPASADQWVKANKMVA